MQILRSRWDLHEMFSPMLLCARIFSHFSCERFFYFPRATPIKINGPFHKLSLSSSAVIGHKTIVWQQFYHVQITRALICTRKKYSNRDLSVGPNHQQNFKIAVSGKFCKDVALSQSYSAKGRRQLVHQVRNGLLSVPAWTRVGHGCLAEVPKSSLIPSHISLLTLHRG